MSARGSSRKNTRTEKPGSSVVGMGDTAPAGASSAAQGTATHGGRPVDRKRSDGQPASGGPAGGVAAGDAPGRGSERIDLVVRVNKRLVLGTLLALSVCGLATHILHTYLVRRNAAEMVERATAAEKDGKLDEAERWLSQYLQMTASTGKDDPKRIDAMVTLASFIEKRAEDEPRAFLSLYNLYEQILRLDATRDTIRSGHIQVALKTGRFRDALVHADALAARWKEQGLEPSPEERAKVDGARAVAQFSTGREQDAVNSFLQAIRLQPTQPDYYSGLAALLLRAPSKLPNREALGEGHDVSLQTCFPSGSPGISVAPIAAERLLRLMCEQSSPAWRGFLDRARLVLVMPGTSAPQSAVAAATAAENLLERFDQNDDQLIDDEERGFEPEIPLPADTDLDNQLSRDELIAWYQNGAAATRLRVAEASVAKAVELCGAVSDSDRSEALVTCHSVAAEIAFQQSVESQVRDPELARQRNRQARESAEAGLKNSPDAPQLLYAAARSFLNEVSLQVASATAVENYQKVTSLAEQGLAALETKKHRALRDAMTPSFVLLRTESLVGIAEIQQDEAAVKAAEQAVAELSPDQFTAATTGLLRGRLLFSQKKWGEARRVLAEADQQTADIALKQRIVPLLAQCHLKFQDSGAAISVLRPVVKKDTDWTAGRIQLAGALAQAGELDEALQSYSGISDIAGTSLEMARLMILRETRKPQSQRNWVAAERVVQAEMDGRAKRGEAVSVEAILLKAELAAQQGRAEEALRVLREARAQAETHPELPATFARLLLRIADRPIEERTADAIAVLDDADSHLGPRVPLLTARAFVELFREESPAGLSDELLQRVGGLEPSQRAEFWQEIAGLWSAKGNRDQAKLALQKQVESDPTAVQPWFELAMIAMRDKDQAGLARILPEVRRVEGPVGALGDFVEAAGLLMPPEGEKTAAAKVQRARTLLEQARVQRPNWLPVVRLLGIVEDATGGKLKALEYFRNAYALGDRSRDTVSRLVSYHMAQRETGEAERLLMEASQNRPELITGPLASLASRIAAQHADFASATKLAEKAAVSENVSDLIWLSQTRSASGMALTEVEQPLRQAIETAAADPAPRLELVAFLARHGRIDEGMAEIARLPDFLPADPAFLIPSVEGRCFELLGKKDQATAAFTRALDSSADNQGLRALVAAFFLRSGQRDLAREQLRVLATAADATLASWARQQEAVLVASAGTFQATTTALKMLEQTQPDMPLTGECIRNLIKVHLLRPYHRDRVEVLRLFSDLRTQANLSPAERWIECQTLVKTGQLARASESLRGLVNEHPNDLGFRAQYVALLLKMLELSRADLELAELEKRAEGTFLVAELRARLQGARGDLDAASATIQDFLVRNDVPVTGNEFLSQLESPAELSEALAEMRQDAAAAGDADRENAVTEIQTLMDKGHHEAAASVFDRLAANRETTISVLRHFHSRSASLLDQLGDPAGAEKVFRTCMERFPAKPEDPLRLAVYKARLGDFDGALDLCRSVVPNGYSRAAAETSIGVLRLPGAMTALRKSAVEQFLRDLITRSAGNAPHAAALYFHLGELCELDNQFGEAMSCYQEALSRNSTNLAAANNLAWMLAVTGRNAGAGKQLIDQAISHSGPIAEILDTRGTVLLALGDPKSAEKDFQEAVSETNSPTTRCRLAVAQHRAGNDQSAATFGQAIQEGFVHDALHPLERQAWAQDLEALTRQLHGRTP